MKCMKKIIFTLIFNASLSSLIHAQGNWTQKASFPGARRSNALGFSIGSKAYIGLGNDGTLAYTDFWEWDQSTNIWTQKANFPGAVRSCAVSFSIGNKGYFGTGMDSTTLFYKDFWEWNQASNTWTQKADLPAAARGSAVGFSIGNKGYEGTGISAGNIRLKDFWEWDQTTNVWVQKADCGGRVREEATGFSIGGKGYIGLGIDSTDYWSGNALPAKDFWEWNQITDIWSQKADFGGVARREAAGFSIGSKGYIGTGAGAGSYNNTPDFWEWDTVTNVWTEKATYTGLGYAGVVGFSVGNKGYLGLGANFASSQQDFWEFDPDVALEMDKVNYFCIINVYPNPTNGKFIIETTAKENQAIQVYDLNGRLAFSKIITHKTNIDATILNEGIYNLVIKSSEGIINKKLVVVK